MATEMGLLLEIKEDITTLRNELRDHVADEMSPHHQASHTYLNVLMQREAKRAKLYDAVIEKTLAGLVWAFLVGVTYACWDYIRDHIK